MAFLDDLFSDEFKSGVVESIQEAAQTSLDSALNPPPPPKPKVAASSPSVSAALDSSSIGLFAIIGAIAYLSLRK